MTTSLLKIAKVELRRGVISFKRPLILLSFLVFGMVQYSNGQSITLSSPHSNSASVNDMVVSFAISNPAGAPAAIYVIFNYTAGYYLSSNPPADTIFIKSPATGSTIFYLYPDSLGNADNIYTSSSNTGIPDGTYSVHAAFKSAADVIYSSSISSNVSIDTKTLPPTLYSPADNELSSSLLLFEDTLPETYLAGSKKLIFTGPVTDTLLFLNTARKDSVYIHANNFALDTPTTVKSFTQSSLPDGTYSVTLSYQDVSGHPVASITDTNFVIRTYTPPASIISPAANSRWSTRSSAGSNWRFLIPSNYYSSSVEVLFSMGLTPFTAFPMSNSLPYGSAFNEPDSNFKSISEGTYNLSLIYSDYLGNPADTVTVNNITIDNTTQAPVLTLPLSGDVVNYTDTMTVKFNLPESFSNSSVKLIFMSGSTTVTTITLTNSTASQDSVLLNITNLLNFSNISSLSGSTSLSDGTYSLILSYQDSLGNPAATDSIGNITVATHTLAPVIYQPVANSTYSTVTPVPISYILPELALDSSVKLIFDSAGLGIVTDTITMINTTPRSTAFFDPHSFTALNPFVSATRDSISDGVYNIKLMYQNSLGDPAASVIDSNITIDTHTLTPSFTSPAPYSAIRGTINIGFILPETPFGNAAVLNIDSAGVIVNTIFLNTLSKGLNTLILDPQNLFDAVQVYNASGATLADGVYNFEIQYSDSLSNPASFAIDSNITIDNTTLSPDLAMPSYPNVSNIVKLLYYIPEEYDSGSVKLVFANGITQDTLVLKNISVGGDSLTLDIHSITSSSFVQSATANSLSDGVYTITLSYQDALGNAPASHSLVNVNIDTHTQTPSISLPASYTSVTTPTKIIFTIPEAYSSAFLVFDSAGTAVNTLTLTNLSVGTDTLIINLKNISSCSNVLSETKNSLSDGIYTITLSYSDALENPPSIAFVSNVTLDTYTQAPILNAPPSNSTISSTMDINFILRENYASGTATLTFDSAGTTATTAVLKNLVVGVNNFTLDPKDLYFSSTHVSSVPNNSLGDGVYSVMLSYQDSLGNPTATVIDTNITIDTHTQAAMLTSPLNEVVIRHGASIPLSFSLPETPLSGTIQAVFTNGSSTYTLTLNDGPAGNFNLTINPDSLSRSTGVFSITPPVSSIPDGNYTVIISYRDVFGNPAVSSNTGTFILDRTTLTPILYLPGTNSTSSGTMNLAFNLPEAALNNTVNIQLTGLDTLSMNLQTSGSGFQEFVVNGNNIPATPGILSHSSLIIPNGIYTLRLSYIDTLGNPAASATETHVTMGNVLPPPVVTTQAIDINCNNTADLNTAITSNTTDLQIAYFSDAAYTTPIDSIAPAGTYYVKVTNVNGLSDTTSIVVSPQVIIPRAPYASSTAVCSGSSTILTAYATGIAVWYTAPTGGTLLFTGDALITPPLTDSTTYFVADSTCIAGARNPVTVLIHSLPLVEASASATTICAGASTRVIAHGALTYAWTGGVQDSTLFTPGATNTYTVTGTDGNNCSNTAWVTVTVNPLPIVTANATDTSICEGTSVTLTGSGAVSYTWQGNQTNGIRNGVSFTPASSDTYSVTGTDLNNCSNMATVPVNVNPMPVNTTTIYSGNVISADQSNATYQWLDCDSNSFAITDEDRQFIVGTVHKDYAVVISLNGCTDTSACVDLIATGINEVTKENTISVYPNPNNGTFTIQSSKGGDYTIVDQLGNIIRTVKINADSNYTMTLDNISSGIYFVIGVNNNEVTRQKLVVTK